MQKKLKKTRKKIKLGIILIIGLSILINPIYTIMALDKNITLGEAEALDGYVAGTHFSIKKTTENEYVYCVDIHKNTAKNKKAKLVGERDAGLAYILENGYPNKSFTGSREKDYYITQSAVWWYLDSTTGSSNLGQAFKTNGSDPYNLRPHIKKLVTNAKKAKEKGYEKVTLKIETSNPTLSLSSDGKYYVSEEIKPTSTNIENYTVSLENAPSGAITIDAKGAKKTTFSSTETVKITIPAANVTNTKLSFSVVAKATGTINKAYEYQPVDESMQSVLLLQKEKIEKESKINLNISTTKVTITKLDKKTNQPIAGAKLVLKDTSGKEIASWNSTTNPHIITNLALGTYSIIEESAPKGYKQNKEATTFTITDTNREVKVNVYNEARTSVVNIIKIDQSTGQPLSGAILLVTDQTGKEIARFETTQDPYVLIDLPDGTYTVEEVQAPNGYMKNDEKITFKIDDDHLSHQITIKNYPEVIVPDTKTNSSIIYTVIGMIILSIAIGLVYRYGKTTK